MASYKIEFASSAERDLRRLPRTTVDRVVVRIERLAEDPLPAQSRKVVGSDGTYRLRVGDYRVLYEVDQTARGVLVLHIRHRREAYRRL